MRTLVRALVVGLLSLAPQAAEAQGRILVMPFENPRRDPQLHWIGEAAALLIADDLSSRGLGAIRRADRVRAFEQLQLPPSAGLSRATVIKVGELVGASEIIVGHVALDRGELVVEAHSIRIDVGRLQPHVRDRGPLDDVVNVFARVAARLAPDASLRQSSHMMPPLEAFEGYVKGLMAESSTMRASFLEAAVKIHPTYDRAHLALWTVRSSQGDHTAALAAAKRVQPDGTYGRRASFLAGVSLIELNRLDEAYDTFKALTTASEKWLAAAAFNNLGIVQLRRPPTPQTGVPTYFFTKATETDAGDGDFLFNLGYAYVLDRSFGGAIYWLREAVRRNPADADAHFVLAAALDAGGSTVEAARELELARQLSSEYGEAERGATAERLPVPRGLERVREDPALRESAGADATIVSNVQREQQNLASFHLERGRALFKREEDREALVELRRAVYLSPYEAEAHLLIARIHLRSGRVADAVDALKISIWSQETVTARIALGEAYVKQQDPAAARREFERALVMDPASADAKRLLATLPVKRP